MDLYSGYGFGIDRNEKIEKGWMMRKKTAHAGDEKGKVWSTEATRRVRKGSRVMRMGSPLHTLRRFIPDSYDQI